MTAEELAVDPVTGFNQKAYQVAAIAGTHGESEQWRMQYFIDIDSQIVHNIKELKVERLLEMQKKERKRQRRAVELLSMNQGFMLQDLESNRSTRASRNKFHNCRAFRLIE